MFQEPNLERAIDQFVSRRNNASRQILVENIVAVELGLKLVPGNYTLLIDDSRVFIASCNTVINLYRKLSEWIESARDWARKHFREDVVLVHLDGARISRDVRARFDEIRPITIPPELLYSINERLRLYH